MRREQVEVPALVPLLQRVRDLRGAVGGDEPLHDPLLDAGLHLRVDLPEQRRVHGEVLVVQLRVHEPEPQREGLALDHAHALVLGEVAAEVREDDRRALVERTLGHAACEASVHLALLEQPQGGQLQAHRLHLPSRALAQVVPALAERADHQVRSEAPGAL
jgi:hypothetical protein